MATRIEAEKTEEVFGTHCIDLVSASLGGEIVAVSDEWFAPATNLLTVAPPIRKPGFFVHTGAWYDGWETRRHNQEPEDWVIVKLGVNSGRIYGFEIDTAFFNGNHAPEITVQALFNPPSSPPPTQTDSRWSTILPLQECGPSQRHVYLLDSPTTEAYSHVKLNMIPDGGIARFRVYGQPVPVFSDNLEEVIDTAHVSNGGLVVACSDQHFGRKDNLLQPERGRDMGDGWETKRSREKGHVDWVIVKLGAPTRISSVTIDTAHFRGNYPQRVQLEGLWHPDTEVTPSNTDNGWTTILQPAKCKADHEHHFTVAGEKVQLGSHNRETNGVTQEGELSEVTATKIFSHVKMTIIPDGGVSRLRVYGRRQQI
ncbi:Allantoicase [Orbilia ellipsospora]|uniref:Allantoicase n=1 Tax=Orbilia ellipsospora TaxID=2528407 RepID=A0AAV9WXD9_9PEZI